jgi:hypothetical protein
MTGIECTISAIKASIAGNRLEDVLSDRASLLETMLDHSKLCPDYNDNQRWMEDACALVIARMPLPDRTADRLSDAFEKWKMEKEQISFLESLMLAAQPEDPK